MIDLHPGDCLDVIPRLVAESVVCDACVTDPPYHLTATQKRFGATNSAPAQYGKDGAVTVVTGTYTGLCNDPNDPYIPQDCSHAQIVIDNPDPPGSVKPATRM